MISVKQLRKSFAKHLAVDGLDFTIQPGEVVGFLGPNGAGKSTTMKMLTGFLPIDSGSAQIHGFDVARQSEKVQAILGYLPEGAPAYDDMTVREFLLFIAQIRGIERVSIDASIRQVVKKLALQTVLHKPIESLSKGFKRRVGLAQAIIHDPAVLILDEPTDGLDPNQKYQVRELIKQLSKDKIVIISTHILEEVTAVCNRAIVIANGRKKFDGTAAELQNVLPNQSLDDVFRLVTSEQYTSNEVEEAQA